MGIIIVDVFILTFKAVSGSACSLQCFIFQALIQWLFDSLCVYHEEQLLAVKHQTEFRSDESPQAHILMSAVLVGSVETADLF